MFPPSPPFLHTRWAFPWAFAFHYHPLPHSGTGADGSPDITPQAFGRGWWLCGLCTAWFNITLWNDVILTCWKHAQTEHSIGSGLRQAGVGDWTGTRFGDRGQALRNMQHPLP